MNWYLETELRNGMDKWGVLRDIFLLMFSFEDEFESINEVLQKIKEAIFRTPKELVEWTQPDWSTQLRHALECYNVTTKEEDDLWNITIPKTKGQCDVEGPKVENPDILGHLKT